MISRRMIGWAVVCFIGSLSMVGTIQAQSAPTRDGFWFSGGLGYGSLGCANCGSRESGLSGGLSLGGTISPRLLLGVGSEAWTKSEQGVTLTVGTVDARVRFYPSATGGFFLTGGVGVGSITGSFGGSSSTETGVGMILGLGYDVRIASNASLTPYWNGFAMRNSNTDANVGNVGLAITLH